MQASSSSRLTFFSILRLAAFARRLQHDTLVRSSYNPQIPQMTQITIAVGIFVVCPILTHLRHLRNLRICFCP